MAKSTEKVGKFWSQKAPETNAGNFYQSPITRPYIIETSFGKEFVNKYSSSSSFAIDIFISEYLKKKKIEKMLSLCCGFGHAEREFVNKLPGIKQCTGLDIAQGALIKARETASEAGLNNIDYKYADLNTYKFDEDKYDLVLANGALHHIKNLEEAIKGIYNSLNPGGLLYAIEYVGNKYQDHNRRQLQLINAAYYLLPDELRGKRGVPFHNHTKIYRPLTKTLDVASRPVKDTWPVWKKAAALIIKKAFREKSSGFNFGAVYISPKDILLKSDPSESIRSSDIIPIIKSVFSKTEIKPFNGGILQNVLDDRFFAHYNPDNIKHRTAFELLCEIEKNLIKTGELGIDNAFIIAEK